MNVSRSTDLNHTQQQDKILKQILSIGDRYLVVIDKSIIQKLGIDDNDNNITFLEQEFRQEDNLILMKIRKMNL
jgi:hypothetical protein